MEKNKDLGITDITYMADGLAPGVGTPRKAVVMHLWHCGIRWFGFFRRQPVPDCATILAAASVSPCDRKAAAKALGRFTMWAFVVVHLTSSLMCTSAPPRCGRAG
jgi:hypothetical protein